MKDPKIEVSAEMKAEMTEVLSRQPAGKVELMKDMLEKHAKVNAELKDLEKSSLSHIGKIHRMDDAFLSEDPSHRRCKNVFFDFLKKTLKNTR